MKFTFRRLLILVSAATFSVPWVASPARAVDLLSENFDQLALQQVVTFQSEVRDRAAWTANVPSGAGVEGTWSVDNTAMPPEASSNLIGVAEFEGWTFVKKDWWVTTAGNQGRADFVSASGTIAVADPDEWDDFGSPQSPTSYGNFDSTLKISNIPLQGIAPNTGNLFFHSSWRQEGNQKASLKVKYNDPAATAITLFQWESDPLSPNFKDDATNEAVNVPILNPAGATTASLELRLFDARNNWWWAVDNMSMFTGAAPAQDGVLRLIVNRDTGNVRIVNNTSATVNLRGYTVASTDGVFNEGAATFLGATNSNWQIFNNPATSDLSEGYIPDQYAMPTQTANPALGVINLGNSWRKYYKDDDDVTFQYLVAGNNTPVPGIVEFIGNGGQSFGFLDLNFDGTISMLDYAAFLTGYNTSLAGKTAAERYNLGDLNGDGKHTIADFQQFKRQFDQLRGPGAFAAALAVPEPTGAALASTLLLGALAFGRRLTAAARRSAAGFAVAALAAVSASQATAALPLLVENFNGIPLGASPEEQPTQTGVWSATGPAGWTIDSSGVPGFTAGDPANNGVRDWAGWNFAKKDWWVTAAGDQNRGQFTRGTGTVLIADPDEWDDAPHPVGKYNTFITTPVIAIPAGVPANKVRIAFDSSWRPEGFDDGDNTNNQTATVDVKYGAGAFQNLLTWDSQAGGPSFHPDNTNEAVDLNAAYNGSATSVQFKFGLTNAANDWWWAIDNVRVFVPSDPAILRINTTNGMAQIVGGDVISETINGYDLNSDNGNLAPIGNLGLSFLGVDKVDGPDAGSVVGDNISESWQLGSANANLFSEFHLDGSSSFTNSRTENLGRVFNPATPAGSRDVTFTYSTIFGDIVNGVVQYFAGPAENADFDGSGLVDGADLLRWQRGLGSGTTLAQGDANGDGAVNAADLTIWKSRFGMPSASAAAGAVPEPTSAALALACAGAAAIALRRRSKAAAVAGSMLCVMALAETSQAQAIPAPTLDRNYRMGDGDPGAANNTIVGVTRDDAGQTGMNQLIDMTALSYSGGTLPRYISVADRPDGVAGLGIQLNPGLTSRQFLRTGADEALNFPERSPSSTEGTLPGGTIDYNFITDRGFQLWARPIALPAANSGGMAIVMDSNNHGVSINQAGKLTMRYSGFDYAGLTTIVPNTWYHLAVVRAFGDRGSGSVLYVNGVAEAAATGIYNGEDAPNDEVNPINHDNSALVVGSITSESPDTVGAAQYFRGTVDDLTMFVMGLNNTRDFGEFQFQRDNKYAAFFAPTTQGDLNGDNAITPADVATFAANWRFEKVLSWTQGGTPRTLVVGDLTTRAKGDFNYDGRVDLADWGILNTVNPAMGAAAMALINAVPEPATLSLAVLAVVAARRRVARSLRAG